MALVDNGTVRSGNEAMRSGNEAMRSGNEAMSADDGSDDPVAEAAPKKVFLVAAFRSDRATTADAVGTGTAHDVVAVIGIAGDRRRFEWVGPTQEQSIANPALVTPVPVRLALPSPWHPSEERVMTGLVQLDHSQLGQGSVDEDIDALLAALATSRGPRA